ncbi:4-hydroxybenzoate 3-monooxygenase [Amycolatopsis jejuensis]|uniref:4-hydroxybenzoate 3-monooxygenase n=1 Tax=Amycolatopsis jejuensis TaxID=330084 RepID=UPI0005262715|nr:4-hydroxybenzoate 3-monooxygenase [Amycolatopsis jejuensis]
MGANRTSVAVVGAGPAGLTVANLLQSAGIGTVVVETETREFIEQRPRAGFIEEWVVRALEENGLANRLLDSAQRHDSFEFRYRGQRHLVPFTDLVGQHHFVYPQQELVTDLAAAYAGDARFGATDVRLHDLESDHPSVTYRSAEGTAERIDCDFVAGCDGARGVTRGYLPPESTLVAQHDYGFGWLALLAQAPPSAERVVFGIHPRGFAAHMARTPTVTRYYLQTDLADTAEDWPDERVWRELHTRLAVPDSPVAEGPLIEKRVLDMHNYVTEPMSHGRLYLAGESAHLVAPIAAKGMNLAIHDALLLVRGLRDWYAGAPETLARYSADCLPRVWQYQEFSLWLSEVFHHTPASTDPFLARVAEARLRRLLGSPTVATAFADMFTGKDADF